MPTARWDKACQTLKKDLGRNTYDNWIGILDFKGIENGTASFQAPTGFIGTYVNQNFGERIRQAFLGAGETVTRLEFKRKSNSSAHSSGQRTNTALAGQTSASPAAPSRRGDDIDGYSLDPRFRFDTFVVGKPNELAHAAARRIAESGQATFNPLFLYGGVGLGKTHLMHAVAWEMLAGNKDARVLYLSAEQFMFQFVRALRFKDTMSFKELFRSVDLLLVDDVQFIAGKNSTQDEFFHTFNALVDQKKQIVISADRAPGEIDGMEERIKSRLQSGLVVDLHPTDYELRLGILQAKVEQHAEYDASVDISPRVLEFLAHRISNNVRVLEGALNRLFALSSLLGRQVTLDMAQDNLSDLLRASDRKVTLDEIIRKVADHYNLRLSDMLSSRRARAVARPRQIAMYLAKTLTSKSLPDIGRAFGGRDHTTIIHGVRKIEELKARDSQITEDLELLRRMLEA